MEKEKISDFFDKVPVFLEPLFRNSLNLWEIIPEIKKFLKAQIKPQMKGIRVGEVYLDHDIMVGEGTIIEHGAMVKGPAVIGAGCQIRSGAYLRGGVFVGDNSIIGHCSEVKNAIILENSSLAHFNYVGDSLIGSKVNISGGAILANLRFDKKEIFLDKINTCLQKFGAILGDECQIGCNTVLNPGTLFQKGIIYSGKSLKSGIYSKEKIKEIIKQNI